MQFGQKLDPNGDGCNETLKNKLLIRKREKTKTQHNTETYSRLVPGDSIPQFLPLVS